MGAIDEDSPIEEGREGTPRRRALTAWIVIIVGIIVIGLAVQQLLEGPGEGLGVASGPATAIPVDEPAPDFQLPMLGDSERKVSLSSLMGQVVVLNFWASWCAPCREEASGLQSAWEQYRSQGVMFLGINEQDDEAGALNFQRDLGITYPSLFDPAGSLAADYRFAGLPATFVIDDEGVLRFRFVGYVSEGRLTSAIDDVVRLTS